MGKGRLPLRQSRGSTRASALQERPIVGVLGGSKSDFPILEKAGAILAELGIPYELLVVSAHRTPDRLFEYATTASERGIQVIIGGAGNARREDASPCDRGAHSDRKPARPGFIALHRSDAQRHSSGNGGDRRCRKCRPPCRTDHFRKPS